MGCLVTFGATQVTPWVAQVIFSLVLEIPGEAQMISGISLMAYRMTQVISWVDHMNLFWGASNDMLSGCLVVFLANQATPPS